MPKPSVTSLITFRHHYANGTHNMLAQPATMYQLRLARHILYTLPVQPFKYESLALYFPIVRLLLPVKLLIEFCFDRQWDFLDGLYDTHLHLYFKVI
jgi:hypothetical protein